MLISPIIGTYCSYIIFTSKVDIPRIKVGNKQEIETLFSEEAYLFAKYLRKEWKPRIICL